MTAAQLQTLDAVAEHEELRYRLVQARYEALAEWGIPLADARRVAEAVQVDILEAVELLRDGCPSHLLLPILR